jgi:hypothetical protein
MITIKRMKTETMNRCWAVIPKIIFGSEGNVFAGFFSTIGSSS